MEKCKFLAGFCPRADPTGPGALKVNDDKLARLFVDRVTERLEEDLNFGGKIIF